MATLFNELVSMDLKMLERQWVLHLIDHVTRFSAAAFVSSKKPEEMIKKNQSSLFCFWTASKFFCLIMVGSSTIVSFGNLVNR